MLSTSPFRPRGIRVWAHSCVFGEADEEQSSPRREFRELHCAGDVEIKGTSTLVASSSRQGSFLFPEASPRRSSRVFATRFVNVDGGPEDSFLAGTVSRKRKRNAQKEFFHWCVFGVRITRNRTPARKDPRTRERAATRQRYLAAARALSNVSTYRDSSGLS
jgi:hypothetical protein